MTKIGYIGEYVLTAEDAESINRRRTTGESIAERMKILWESISAWPKGAQAHIGSEVKEGDVFPMFVTRVNEDGTANGQVLLDGNDVLWVKNLASGGTDG